MGIGYAKGDNAAVKAMKAAIDSKLLEENSIKGAKGALINITGSKNMPMVEIEDALALIHDEADENANIIFGTVFNEDMEDEVKITVIATGFENHVQIAPAPENPIVKNNYLPNNPIPIISKNKNLEEFLDVSPFERKRSGELK